MMKRKWFILIITLCVVIIAAAGIIYATQDQPKKEKFFFSEIHVIVPGFPEKVQRQYGEKPETGKSTQGLSEEKQREYRERREKTEAEAVQSRLEQEEANKDLWTKCYERATPEQREQLEELKVKCSGLPSDYPKQILLIMGDLPEDTPGITLEQARAIIATLDIDDFSEDEALENEIIRRFNPIAGAPDYDGGSGFRTVIYYVDGDPSKCISICFGTIEYIDVTNHISETLFPLPDK